MASTNEAQKKTLKQSQSIMANSFNMGELLRSTTQLFAGNYNSLNGQGEALDLSINLARLYMQKK